MLQRTTSLALVLILVVGLAGPISAQGNVTQLTAVDEIRIPLNRLMGASNDNRDPNWDWTVNTTYQLSTHSQTFSGVRLPYYSNSGPAAALLNDAAGRDIFPADGWELVLRDFGPVAVPFFILYNKYRGTLRIFFFSTLSSTFSHGVGRLSFQDTTSARSAAHFTLSEKSVFVDNYNPSRSQVALGAIQPQQWGFFDFDVSGYDPNISTKNDPTFIFEIAGVTQSDLTAVGEVDLTTGPVSTMANMRPGSGFIDTVFSAIDNVNKRHKSVKEFRNTINEQVDKNGSKWWAAPLKAIQFFTDKSWFGALGPVAGFLDFVLGGGSRNSSLPFPLATKGGVSLRGQISTETSVYTLIFRVPGSNHLTPGIDADSNVLPLYDVPLGLFNVRTKPAFDVDVTSDTTELLPTCDWEIDVQSRATKNLQIDVNSNVFSSSNITVTWAPLNSPARRFVSVSSFNNQWNNTYFGGPEDANLYADIMFSQIFFLEIAIKAVLTPAGGASGLEPITLYKTYAVSSNVDQHFSGSSCPGGGMFLRISGLDPQPGGVEPSDPEAFAGLLSLLEENQAARGWQAPVNPTDYVSDYLSALLAGNFLADPLATLTQARRNFRANLDLWNLGEAFTEEELAIVEAGALRTLAHYRQSLRTGETTTLTELVEQAF